MNANELSRVIEDEKHIGRLCRDELAGKPLNSRAEKRAFISAVMFAGGSLIIRNKQLCALVSTKSEQVKKAVAAVFASLGAAVTAEKKGARIEVVAHSCPDLLAECKVLTGENAVAEHIDPEFFSSPSIAAAYMRGAFLGSGSLSVSQYHLEFQFGKLSIAKDFCSLCARYGIKTEVTVIREKAVVYCCDSQQISDALAFMGGVKCVLGLNSVIAARYMNAHLNRQQNCEMYNMDKQINASVEQCAYFKELDLDKLSPQLRQTVQVRLNNPDYSYAQLASALGITKSGLKNRLKKLKAVYIREKETTHREE